MSYKMIHSKNNKIAYQQVFFDNLDKDMIAELIHRANEQVLANDINEALIQDGIHNITTTSETVSKLEKNGLYDISIYINFYRNNNTKPYSHISLHLSGTDYNNNKGGPLHLKVENIHKRDKVYFRIEPVDLRTNNNITKQGQNGITLSKIELKYEPKNITGHYTLEKLKRPEYKIALKVLEKYLNHGEDYMFLNFHKTTQFNKTHKYVNNIIKSRRVSKLPLIDKMKRTKERKHRLKTKRKHIPHKPISITISGSKTFKLMPGLNYGTI